MSGTQNKKGVVMVECPLCLKPMRYTLVIQRGIYVWCCDRDRVAISESDPMLGRWEELYAKGEKVECIYCNADMRFFCTSTGFIKCKCPKKKCGAGYALGPAPEDVPDWERTIAPDPTKPPEIIQ